MFGPKTVLLLFLAVALSRGSVPGSDDANSVEGRAVEVPEQNVTEGKSLEDEFLDDLTDQCSKEMTLTCVRRNLYTYVGKSLDVKNLKITESLVFEKSDGKKIHDARSDRSMKLDEEEKEEGEEKKVGGEEEGKNSFEDVLYEKGARFLMSHDLSIQLPKTFFDGATLKFSPKSLEDDGVLIKLEMPKAPAEEKSLEEGEKGRLFFHHKHKHFKKRLIMGFFALLLVIKLIKIKLLYLLPIILGVGTVKKLILKALIFIFPAFASIFKYCAGHKTHHHHTVAYHHLPVEPSIFDDWGPGPGGPDYHRRNEHTANGGYLPDTAPGYYHYAPPPKGYHPFLDDDRINRNVVVSEPPQFQYPPHPNANPRPPPKLSGFSKPSYSRNPPPHPPQNPTRFNQHSGGHNVPPPPHRVVAPPQAPVQQQVASVPAVQLVPAQQVHIATAGGNQKVYSPAVEEAVVRGQITLQQQQTALQQQQQALQQQALLHQQALALQRQQQLQREQALLLQQQRLAAMTTKNPATAADTTPAPRIYDSFYSPILQKIDSVFSQMSFAEEGCRERLVCSMYKNPTRFSPHSNLISAELSRDPSELQKPTSSNPAVVRFYRYVQAAKDGQEGRDCLRIYASCSVKTEK